MYGLRLSDVCFSFLSKSLTPVKIFSSVTVAGTLRTAWQSHTPSKISKCDENVYAKYLNEGTAMSKTCH